MCACVCACLSLYGHARLTCSSSCMVPTRGSPSMTRAIIVSSAISTAVSVPCVASFACFSASDSASVSVSACTEQLQTHLRYVAMYVCCYYYYCCCSLCRVVVVVAVLKLWPRLQFNARQRLLSFPLGLLMPWPLLSPPAVDCCCYCCCCSDCQLSFKNWNVLTNVLTSIKSDKSRLPHTPLTLPHTHFR